MKFTLDDEQRKVIDIMKRYPTCLDNYKLFSSLMADILSQNIVLKRILCNAFEEGIITSLRDTDTPKSTCLYCERRLVEKCGMTDTYAKWVMATFATYFGYDEDLESNDNTINNNISRNETIIQNPESLQPGKFPSYILLQDSHNRNTDDYVMQQIQKLQAALNLYIGGVRVVDYHCGSNTTIFFLRVDPGIRINSVVGLKPELQLSLSAIDIDILFPLSEQYMIGIEIPNANREYLHIKKCLESMSYRMNKSPLAFVLGEDRFGNDIIVDVDESPLILIGGATGTGKTMCVHSMIISLLYKYSYEDVKLILIDTKQIEMQIYNSIPHLLIPVISDAYKAMGALNWALLEMKKRYQLFSEYNVSNISDYNELVDFMNNQTGKQDISKMSRILIVVDDYADIANSMNYETENAIIQLSDNARVTGIYLVFVTQRPSVNIIKGAIKSNFTTRISFMTSSMDDSRIILGEKGAELLLGKGDMLYLRQGCIKPERVQGCFVSDEEIYATVDYFKSSNNYQTEGTINKDSSVICSDNRDEYLLQAAEMIMEQKKASIGMLQRRLKIGFNRAARIMDQLAAEGIVGPDLGTSPRQILMDYDSFELWKTRLKNDNQSTIQYNKAETNRFSRGAKDTESKGFSEKYNSDSNNQQYFHKSTVRYVVYDKDPAIIKIVQPNICEDILNQIDIISRRKIYMFLKDNKEKLYLENSRSQHLKRWPLLLYKMKDYYLVLATYYCPMIDGYEKTKAYLNKKKEYKRKGKQLRDDYMQVLVYYNLNQISYSQGKIVISEGGEIEVCSTNIEELQESIAYSGDDYEWAPICYNGESFYIFKDHYFSNE